MAAASRSPNLVFARICTFGLPDPGWAHGRAARDSVRRQPAWMWPGVARLTGRRRPGEGDLYSAEMWFNEAGAAGLPKDRRVADRGAERHDAVPVLRRSCAVMTPMLKSDHGGDLNADECNICFSSVDGFALCQACLSPCMLDAPVMNDSRTC